MCLRDAKKIPEDDLMEMESFRSYDRLHEKLYIILKYDYILKLYYIQLYYIFGIT
jgi:hypothetical protein